MTEYTVIIMLISHVISIISFTIFIDQHLKNYAIIDNIKMIMRILDELICGSRLIDSMMEISQLADSGG